MATEHDERPRRRPRRWSEPGAARWFTIILYAAVAALALYFAVRLTTALARRFGAIRRAYPLSEARSHRARDEVRSERATGGVPMLWKERAL